MSRDPKAPRGPSESERFWAHVTAFGALWGALEITLGSFLHALRLPFAGVLMASLSAALLVAQRQLWPRRGLTAATGLVAALCKSISPGGIILGPMIGIMTEALLVELALLLAPRALPLAALAGALCALWSAFQKVITQFVVYGASVIELYLAALRRAGDWLGISAAAGWRAAIALLSALVLLGALGGALGHRLGRDARTRREGAAR